MLIQWIAACKGHGSRNKVKSVTSLAVAASPNSSIRCSSIERVRDRRAERRARGATPRDLRWPPASLDEDTGKFAI
jgi:hypothetical protein